MPSGTKIRTKMKPGRQRENSSKIGKEKTLAERKRFKQRRRLQMYLKKAWPPKSSAADEYRGYGNARKCPQCAVIAMRVDEKTVCAHNFNGPCFYCHGSHGDVTWRCIECEINFCSSCVCHHIRTPVLSTHRLILRILPNGMAALGEHADKGYAEIFYKDWMMASNIILTCDEQEHCRESCTEEKCDVESRHDIDCDCSRDACKCQPLELDYVLYMNNRLLEKAYKTNTPPKVLCLQCEISRRHDNINSMKRLKRAKRILKAEVHRRDLNQTMNKLAEAFCNQLNQPMTSVPPPPPPADDSVPELTDTDDDGGPLEDDFDNIKPGVIVCDHEHNREYRNPPYLFPNQRPKVQADLENDPSFQYLDSPSDSESTSSDSDLEDINRRLEKILAQASDCKFDEGHKESSDDGKQTKQGKSKRKRKSKSKKDKTAAQTQAAEAESADAAMQLFHAAAKSLERGTDIETELASLVKSKRDVRTEVRSILRSRQQVKLREHNEIIRKKAELPKNIPNALTISENPHEDHELTEYTTFNQAVADLLDIRGFNERLNGLGESDEPVSTMKQAEEVKQKLIDLKSWSSKQYVHALSVVPEADVATRKELERMATKQMQVVDTTLSDFTIQRNIIEANQLSTLVAQKLQDRKGKDGRPLVESLKEITVHTGNTPPVSMRVLNKTQRFSAGKQHSRTQDTTQFKINIRQTEAD